MKILLAVDDSKFSDAAVKAVIARAHPKDTEVRVLHVVEPPWLLMNREMGGPNSGLEAVWESETKQAMVLVEKTAETLRSQRDLLGASKLEEEALAIGRRAQGGQGGPRRDGA